MATYKEIKGVTVQTKDEDPVANAGTWASGGSLNTARTTSGAGKQTANLAFGGDVPGGRTNICESYDGTSWTEVNDMNTSRSTHGGMGTYTAALAAGGRTSPTASTAISEEWNGSAWTEGNDLNQSRYAINNRGAGTQTAGLCVGGNRRLTPQGTTSPNAAPQNFFTGTEEYDGTSWTEVNDVPTGAESGGGLGTQTAAGMWGLYNGSLSSPTYRASGFLYDGTNWTTTADFPIEGGMYSESGTTTDGLAFGIYNNNTSPTSVTNTVAWDGTAWTEVNDISTARYAGGGGKAGADPSQVAILAGGYTTTQAANTEEWSFPPVTQAKLKEGMVFLSGGTTLKGFGKAASVPSVAWSSGTNLPNPWYQDAGSGSSNTAALHFGGRESGSGSTAKTQTYNGSTFTEVNDMSTARRYLLGSGTQTSTLAYGGYTTTNVADVESWDGTNWTAASNLNQARAEQKGTGKSATAALAIAGNPSSPSFKTEQWDGSSWTEVAEMNTSRIRCGTAGTSTASLAFLGESPGDVEKKNEEWNGTSWTEIADLNTERYLCGSGGDGITDALAFGGNGSLSAACEYWNGSSWAEINDLSTATYIDASAGHTSQSVMKMGGYTTTQVATTEEFTVTTATLSDITVS